MDTVGDALVEYGFVAIDNHGVDRFAIADTYTAAQNLRASAPVKQGYEDPAGDASAATPFGCEHAKNRR